MPLPFDFEGKGVLELVAGSASSSSSSQSPCSNPFVCKRNDKKGCFLSIAEPNSVLDTVGSPSPPTSSTTLSSSLAGGDTAAVAGNPSQKWPPAAQQETTSSSNVGVESGCGSSELHVAPPPTAEMGGTGAEKCGGLGMEDWESMLSESAAASPGQEQSILRWIMGDVEDPSMGLNKLLQSGVPPPDFDFAGGGGFGGVDQVSGLDPVGNLMSSSTNPSMPTLPQPTNKLASNPSNLPSYKLPNPPNSNLSPLPNNLMPISLSSGSFTQTQVQPLEFTDVKPQIFNPQLLINQHQAHSTQNPAFFLPFPHNQQENQLLLPPPAKRHNPGALEPNPFQPQLQLLPSYLHQRPTMGIKPKIAGDEMGHHHHHQQAVVDQLFKAAELVQSGNSALAQGILARLNHQLSSPIGKPFQRAAFFCKEALQLLLNHQTNPNITTLSVANSPFNLILKIGAYKSFSEISPLLQFANFTCNQALLEVFEGFDRIHIVDFDIGYGGQWASLMQELALRNNGAPSLKITVFASPSTHDQLELGLTRENLTHFAAEINMAFEFEVLSIDALHSASWSLPLHISENEAVAVNLPVGSFSTYQLSVPLVLRFVKQLSPKIVVSVDRGCDRTDLPVPSHVIHALQSYSNLLESLDAVNVNLEALQKIERFLVQPGIEKIVMGRFRSPEKTPHWRTAFLSSGLSPFTFSNFAESQAECVIKRTPVRGFHIEKRQSSLVLCWQRKELISASAWSLETAITKVKHKPRKQAESRVLAPQLIDTFDSYLFV
ncbi:hypothetical protein NMG60_11023059 [Bertholletia excelsa]